MIRFIKGALRVVEEGLIIVEASGIGYGIRVPESVLSELPAIGEELCIHTYFSVREDSMELFGFLHPEDRGVFVQLLSVSGVGPKGALAILSVLRPDRLRAAIISGDSKAIQAAPGIGKRTAERVILDLRDKVDASELYSAMSDSGTQISPLGYGRDTAEGEAIEALVALGYSMSEAQRAVGRIELKPGMTSDDVLKQSLRHLAF